MRPPGWSRRLSLALVSLCLLASFFAALPWLAHDAEAHAALVRSNPESNEQLRFAPARVSLHFSEPIERKLTQIEVLTREEERVDADDIEFADDNPSFASVGVKALDPGLYFVRWSNVSKVDGHGVKGVFPFIVLNADGTLPAGIDPNAPASISVSGTQLLPENVDSALKWAAMVSLAAVAGAAFFVVAVLRPAAAFLGDRRHEVSEAGEGWLVNLAHVLLPLSFIASAALVIIAVGRFETATSVWSYLTTVRVGTYRMYLLALLVIALVGGDLLYLSKDRLKRNVGIALLTGGTASALLTYSLVSHSAGETGKFWAVTADYVHLVASAVWLGTLILLIPVLRWAKRALDSTDRFLLIANVFDRFSIAAALSVIVILASGVFNGLVEIPEWDAFTSTTYGKVLLAKLALVALLLPVAGLNAFVLKPRLVNAIDASYGRDAQASPPPIEESQLSWLQRWLPRTIALEALLVVAVFASVSVLSQTSTAAGEIAQEQAEEQASAAFKQTVDADGVQITLEITPNVVGLNDFGVTLRDEEGRPIEAASFARLRLTYDQDPTLLPQSAVILNERRPGEFRVGQVSDLSQPGNWRLDLTVRRDDGDDISHAFVISTARPSVIDDTTGGRFDLPFDQFTWNEVLGALLVLGGAVIVVYRGEIRRLPGPALNIAMTAAAAMLLGGGVLVFGVDTHVDAENARAGNPVTPTRESVERGRMLYMQNCAVCHGDEGRGDGPAAADLNPAPTDFRQHIPNHPDTQFFTFIADGYPQTEMPKFREAFSEDDIWNLVNFLRSEFTEAPSE